MPGLANGQLDCIRIGSNDHPHRSSNVFDTSEEAGLIEKAMINCDIETTIAFYIEQAV